MRDAPRSPAILRHAAAALVALLVLAWVALPATAQKTHVVRAGETLYRIATENGLTVERLKTLNRLISNDIRVGQVLVVDEEGVPGGETISPSGPPDSVGGEPVAEKRFVASGRAGIFPETYAGRAMAGGDTYDPQALVASHRELPIGAVLLVENRHAGRVTFVEVADRGPVDDALLVELSRAAADTLHLEAGGSVHVWVLE